MLSCMVNVSKRWKAYGNNRDEDGAMGNGLWIMNLGGSEGGSDSDSHEMEKVGMVWTRQKNEKKEKTSEQLSKWRWRGSALGEDQGWDGREAP